jgi:hypothetical protein
MKGEHGAVARVKSARSNRWGVVNDAAGEEASYPSTMSSETRDVGNRASSQQRRTSSSSGGVSNNLRGNQDPVLAFGGKVKSLQSIKKDIFRSADTLKLPQGQESRVFHRSNFYDQNVVIRSASAYADFIIEDACERGIPEEQRQCRSRNAEGIPSQEIRKAWSGNFVVNASYVHMGRKTGDDLAKIQAELEEVMSHLQPDPTRMTQFRGWYSRNAERSKEARERCFHWSAPGTPQLPRLQFSESLHKLSVRLTRFLQIGGMLHDDCVARSYIPPGFAYQIWLDKVRAYRSVLEKNRQAHVAKTAVQLFATSSTQHTFFS